MAGITEWWALRTTNQKTGIVIGGIVTLGLIAFGVWHFTKDDKKKSKSSAGNSGDTPTETKSDTNDTGKTDSKSEKTDTIDANKKTPNGTGDGANSTASTSNQSGEIDLTGALPNAGVGCSPLRTNFDMDFDYVKCNGVWYTKSKPDAKTVEVRTLYTNWHSIDSNKVACERLARRYPKD